MMKNITTTRLKTVVLLFFAGIYVFFAHMLEVIPIHDIPGQASFLVTRGQQDFYDDRLFFYVPYLLSLMPAGWLVSRLDERVVLVLSCLVAACGTLLLGTSTQYWVTCFAQGVAAVGSVFAILSSVQLALDRLKPHSMSVLIGVVCAVCSAGMLTGFNVLPWALNSMGWRQTILLMGLVFFVLSILFWILVDDRTGLMGGEKRALSQLRATLKHRQFLWLVVIMIALSLPEMVLGGGWLKVFLAKAMNVSLLVSSHFSVLYWVGCLVTSLLAGWCSAHLRLRRSCIVWMTGCSVIAALWLLMAPMLSLWVVSVAAILVGFSAGAWVVSLATVYDIVPTKYFAVCLSVCLFFSNLSALTGYRLVRFLMQFASMRGMAVYQVHHYQVAMLIIPLVLMIGLIVSVKKLRETHTEKRC